MNAQNLLRQPFHLTKRTVSFHVNTYQQIASNHHSKHQMEELQHSQTARPSLRQLSVLLLSILHMILISQSPNSNQLSLNSNQIVRKLPRLKINTFIFHQIRVKTKFLTLLLFNSILSARMIAVQSQLQLWLVCCPIIIAILSHGKLTGRLLTNRIHPHQKSNLLTKKSSTTNSKKLITIKEVTCKL